MKRWWIRTDSGCFLHVVDGRIRPGAKVWRGPRGTVTHEPKDEPEYGTAVSAQEYFSCQERARRWRQ